MKTEVQLRAALQPNLIHPLVISDTGIIHGMLRCHTHMENLGVYRVLAAVQEAVLLNTCRILRNFFIDKYKASSCRSAVMEGPIPIIGLFL